MIMKDISEELMMATSGKVRKAWPTLPITMYQPREMRWLEGKAERNKIKKINNKWTSDRDKVSTCRDCSK